VEHKQRTPIMNGVNCGMFKVQVIVISLCFILQTCLITFLSKQIFDLKAKNDIIRLQLENERNNRVIREIDPRAVNFE
jgi:hypothetical protein